MHGAYMICTETYGNGAGIGMELMRAERRPIRGELLPVPTAWYAAAIGTKVRGAFVQRTGPVPNPTNGTVSASVSFAPEFEQRTENKEQRIKNKEPCLKA